MCALFWGENKLRAFTILRGIAAPLDEANIDTNQICPSRFNKMVMGPGYERVLFHDRRFNIDGTEKPGYILNNEPYRRAQILVAGRNFGCGSSRETAVTALLGFGIRAVISPEFADIFFNNALKNGLLPVTLDETIVAELQQRLRDAPTMQVKIDLESRTVALDGESPTSFEIEDLMREKLLLGLDDIALTDRFAAQLPAFEAAYYRQSPWLPADDAH